MIVTTEAIEAAANAFWDNDQFRIPDKESPAWVDLDPAIQAVCRDIVAPILHAVAPILEQYTLQNAVESGQYVKVADPSPFGEIEDDFGSTWALCRPDCGLQVVRPGKVQCDHEGTSTDCGPDRLEDLSCTG